MTGLTPTERPASWRELALLLLAAFAILAPGISSLPAVDRDESRYATATTRMLDTHDWVDIRFQEQPRYLQPAGVYWLQSVTAGLLTEPGHRQIWAFRLPSLLGALIAVGMTAWAGSRVFGRTAGLMAGGLLAACMSLGFEARIAKTDAVLLASVTTAQFALMRVYLDQARSWRTPAVFWAALGAGLLVKGPIIVLVTALTVAALCLWDRRVGWLKRLRTAWGVPLFLLVGLPWYVAIGVVSEGHFFTEAIGKSFLQKVGTGQQGHSGPFGYHLALFPIMFWPASLLALLAAPLAWRERSRPEVRFLIAWIVPAWLMFELVSTKLPHYVLPTYPAVATLCALALLRPRSVAPVWMRVAFGIGLVIWLGVSLLLAGLGPIGFRYYDMGLNPVAAALSALTIAAVGALLWFLWKGRAQAVVISAMFAAVLTTANVYAVSLPDIGPIWLTRQILDQAVAPAGCRRVIVTTPYHEPSLVFSNGPTVTELARDGAHAAERFVARGRCAVAVVGAVERPAFLAALQARGVPARPIGRVVGENYSDGKDRDLILYAPVVP